MEKRSKGVNPILLPYEAKKNSFVDGLIQPEISGGEAVEGLFYLQASPTWKYQTVLLELSRQFVNYLVSQSFLIFNTPFDLRIPGTGDTDADNIYIFRPDIVLISNKNGGNRVDYFGPPSLVVEILTSMTGKWDRVLRLNKYEEIGIKEYWVIEPEAEYTCVFILRDGESYGKPEVYTRGDMIPVSTFPDLTIDLMPVFALV
jgi:Uma2 family endonuclease